MALPQAEVEAFLELGLAAVGGEQLLVIIAGLGPAFVELGGLGESEDGFLRGVLPSSAHWHGESSGGETGQRRGHKGHAQTNPTHHPVSAGQNAPLSTNTINSIPEEVVQSNRV